MYQLGALVLKKLSRIGKKKLDVGQKLITEASLSFYLRWAKKGLTYVISAGLNACFTACHITSNLSWVRWNITVAWVDVVIPFNKKKKNSLKLKELTRHDKIRLNMFPSFINNGNYSFFYCFNYFYKWSEELFVHVTRTIFEVWIL